MRMVYKSVADEGSAEKFQPYSVNGYLVSAPLTSEGGGNCKWGFCTKNGYEYFLKEFLTPKYPSWSANISEEMREMQKAECTEWMHKRSRVYTAVRDSNRGNLVIPLDFFRDQNKYYLVTERVVSNTVAFEELVRLPIEQKLVIMKILAYQLAALSENHVVHSDLKPDNLMFKSTVNGHITVKIIDFDASFMEDDLPDPDEMVGDSVYYSPEAVFYQVTEGEGRVTSKADVFSLGIIFHQILAGTLPYYREDAGDTLGEAVLNGCPAMVGNEIPELFRPMIAKMLEREAENRMSAAQVWDELFRIYGQTPKKMMKNHPTAGPKIQPQAYPYSPYSGQNGSYAPSAPLTPPSGSSLDDPWKKAPSL